MEEWVDEPPASTRPPAPPDGGGIEIDVHRPRSGVVLLLVRGELVAQTVAALEGRLADALTPDYDGRRVTVDLSGVTSITPPGLDVLLRFQDRLAAAGGRLELLTPSVPVVLLLHEAATG